MTYLISFFSKSIENVDRDLAGDDLVLNALFDAGVSRGRNNNQSNGLVETIE